MFLLAVKDAEKQLLSDLDCCPISRCGWATNMFLYVFVQPTDLSVTNQDSWLPRSIEIDQKPGRKFRLGLMGALLQQREGEQTAGSLACSLPQRAELIPYKGRGGECVQRLGQRVGIGGVPTTLVVVCAGGMCKYSVFAPGSSGVAVLYLVVHNLPMHTFIFSLLQFLCILLLEEMFVQVQAPQQRVPGLISTQQGT